MCSSEVAEHGPASASAPRPAPGTAVDPIDLEPVDEVVITTLVDNSYDALLTTDARATRAPFGAGVVPAAQFENGTTTVGMRAEHGFSALVTIRRGPTTTTLLFDTGLSPDAMVTNASRLGLDLSAVQALVLSHGHFDHAGGLAGLAGRHGARTLPMVAHPAIWTRRRMAIPGRDPEELPTLSKRALNAEGLTVIERRVPSLLVDNCALITGEIDRTTEFERGMPPAHQAWNGSTWEHDPLVLDDQALVMHVRGRGLVVLTGCAHAGAINIVRHAQRLTGVPTLHALVGGLHLSGPTFEPIIGQTVELLSSMAPALVVAGHCTGWRAQHQLAAALPAAWLPGSSGSSFRLSAA
jgi:7,8-dihydropterin-6-yl-methyl-4-(beta-D-ribofuranosyl)aminobenzene 5'-phosphate synthase